MMETDAERVELIDEALPELADCPFCGGDDLTVEACCYVRCSSCGCEGPVFDGHPADDWREQLAALWNTRTPTKDTPQ